MEKEIIMTREEFEAMIDDMNVPQMRTIIERHCKLIEYSIHTSRSVNNYSLKLKTRKYGTIEAEFVSSRKHDCLYYLLLRLYDNDYLSDYIKSLQLNQPTGKKL